MCEAFKSLYPINVNEHVEEKNGLKYLSWSWAWSEVMKKYPDASYEIVKFDNLPYQFIPGMGYMVYTRVTIEGMTREMWLPVMDAANKPMMEEPYEYQVYNRFTKQKQMRLCERATVFDINKTIMRCLVKNLAMFGLGLYIYSGEDLPEAVEEEEVKATPNFAYNPEQETGEQATKRQLDMLKQIPGDVLMKGLGTFGVNLTNQLTRLQAMSILKYASEIK